MEPYLQGAYGNPNAIYGFGKDARKAIDKARAQVATLVGCDPSHIVFTSCGSEGNSMAIKGTHRYLKAMKRPLVLTTGEEHESVYNAAKSFLNYVPTPIHTHGIFDDCGSIIPSVLEKEFRNNPLIGMVSMMYVNNEFGSVNPVKEIATICHAHNVLYHTDCVQAAGFVPLDVNDIGCDFLTISGHKIHAPKGIGALYVRDFDKIEPIVYGSDYQEFGFRGGTQNVAAIVGFGKACEISYENLKSVNLTTSGFKQIFYTELKNRLETAGIAEIMHVNGEPVIKNGKILSLRFDGIDGEALVLMADIMGVCISTGSACHGDDKEPSRALLTLGLTEQEAHSTIRVSFSRMNTQKEIVNAAETIAKCVETLYEQRNKVNKE